MESDLVACATGPIEELAQKASGPIDELTKKTIIKECMPTTSQEVKQGCKALIEEELIVTRPILEILADIEKAGGKVPLSNTVLCREIKILVQRLVKECNYPISSEFRKKFFSKFITENGIKKKIDMNLDHILNSIVKITEDAKEGVLKIEYSGGHLAGSTQALENKGLIKIISKKQLKAGCWEYDCKNTFTGRKFTKTEFPSSWSAEQIIQRSWNLFDNKTIYELKANDGKFSKSITIGKQELKIIIKKHDHGVNIITAVPYIEET